VSEAVALAARERKESRGAHARADHQAKDAEWGKFNLVIRKARDGSMEIRREPIPQIRQDLQDIIKEQG
jgi:succinate dehydrogenase / fumarate reductase flavoprotein subunit